MGIINEGLVNSDLVNGPEEVNVLFASGNIISLVQEIGIVASGNIIPLVQTTVLTEKGSGNIISLSQSIHTTASGNIIQLSQNIREVGAVTKLDQFGWDVSSLIIGEETIDTSRIIGTINFNTTEDGSPQLDITIKLDAGTVSLSSFQGKDVRLTVITTLYGTHRLFTGKVDIPEIDMIWDRVTLRCSANRDDLVNSQTQAFINSIGLHSSHIFKSAPNKVDQLEQRLSTVPQSMEVTNYNTLALVNWLPKDTADHTFVDADIIRDTPKPLFRVGSSSRVINQININFEYRYDINYHMQRTFQWTSLIENNFCLFLVMGYDMGKRSVIQAAADSAGWPLNGTINFGDIPASGVYRCGVGNVAIVWSTTVSQTVTAPVIDADGVQVKDVNGNAIYSSVGVSEVDNADIFSNTASWTATTRWAQTINEKYSVTVQSSESITQYDVKPQAETHGIQSTFDSSIWEDYTSYENLGLGTTYFIRRDTNLSEFNAAVYVVLNRARTKILSTHRDSRVEFTLCNFYPAIQLFHTVATNASTIQSRGKVFNIYHELNVETGEAKTIIKTAISSIDTVGSDSALSIPTRPSYSPTVSGGSVFLGNHFGEDPTSDAAKTWNGMIGNKFLGAFGAGTYKTQYQTSFVVDTPPIEASLRNEVNVSASTTYNVSIPDDLATITVDDVA